MHGFLYANFTLNDYKNNNKIRGQLLGETFTFINFPTRSLNYTQKHEAAYFGSGGITPFLF